MNTAKQVEQMLNEWKLQGLSAPDIVVNLANACMGWAYVFGARGEYCTPANRQRFYNSQKKETIKTKCKNFSGSGSCSGCKWYPGGQTRFFDCRGFTYWCLLNGAGIKINGAGASSQYNDDSNWSEKGDIANMPKDKVCCVFRYDSNTKKYEHTLLYDGNGHYIHCSGEVKKCDVSKYNATHYGLPKGLYDGGGGGGKTVEKATVHADSGSTVNLRSSASTSASIVARVPVGSVVDVDDHGTTWCHLQYNGKSGYMMTQFLIFGGDPTPAPTPTPTGDTVVVNRADLETIYTLVSNMLNTKG